MSENKMSPEELENLKKDFPSIELAYPISVASYESLVKRHDALDTKMQGLTTLSLTMFLVIPTLGNARQLSFDSPYFYTSIILLLLSIGVSLYSRTRTAVVLLDPGILWDNYLALDEFEFKKEMIYHAADNYKVMNGRIERNWRFNVASLTLFGFALLSAFFWLAAASRP